MMVIGKPFIFLVLSTGPVYVDSAAKRVPKNYANKVDIPSGVYGAVKKDNNHISDVLPMINDFKLYVESYPDGQRAQLEIVTDGTPPLISDVMPIRKYNAASIYKDLEFDGQEYYADCFYFDDKKLVGYFQKLYNQIGMSRKKITDKDIILCKMQKDLTFKIGVWPKRNLPDRELTIIGGVNDFIALTKVNEHVILPTPHVEVEAPDQFPLLRATLKRPLTREKELVQAKRLKVNDDKVTLTTPEAIPDGLYTISEINDVNKGELFIYTDWSGQRKGDLKMYTKYDWTADIKQLQLKLINGMWELALTNEGQKSDAMNIKTALRLEETTTTEHPFHISKDKVWNLMVGDEPNRVILLQLQPEHSR